VRIKYLKGDLIEREVGILGDGRGTKRGPYVLKFLFQDE